MGKVTQLLKQRKETEMKKLKGENQKEQEGQEEVDLDKNRFHIEPVIEHLPYTFTEQEKGELGKQLAKCFADHTEAEGRLKSIATQIKAEIAMIDGEMTSLSEKIRSGKEYRNVKCEKTFDYRLGVVTYIRLDTGEVYRERPLDEAERQASLNLKISEEDETEEAA